MHQGSSVLGDIHVLTCISLDVWRILIMSYTCKIYRLSSRNIGYKLRASFPNSGIRYCEPGGQLLLRSEDALESLISSIFGSGRVLVLWVVPAFDTCTTAF